MRKKITVRIRCHVCQTDTERKRWPIERCKQQQDTKHFWNFLVRCKHAEWLNVWCLKLVMHLNQNQTTQRTDTEQECERESERDPKHKICFCSKRFSTQFSIVQQGPCTSGFSSPSTLRVDRISGFHCWCAVSSVSCSRLYSLHPDNVAHSNLHYACRTLDVIHIFGSIFRFFLFSVAIYLRNMICESKWLYSVSFNRKC